MKFEIKDWEPKKIPEKYHKKVKWMVIYIDHGVPTRIWGEKIKNKKKKFFRNKKCYCRYFKGYKALFHSDEDHISKDFFKNRFLFNCACKKRKNPEKKYFF